MAVGLSTAGLANLWLDQLGGAATTPGATLYVQLHTGDPGAAGTTAASANTTRVALTWSAAASGSKSISNQPSWSSWAAGAETISHISVWDASTAGNFRYSFALTAAKSITNGDTFTLTSHSFSITPLAA
jgi:hypothetical protein